MAGLVKVTISNREWLASLARDSWELVRGLGGIAGIDSGTGVLFDLGIEQDVTVTTEPMLFPLDIAFLNEELVITEIYRNVQPGYLVQPTSRARFFLEVNAGELEGVEAGSQASLEILALQEETTTPGWFPSMASFLGFTLMGTVMVGLVKDVTKDMFTESRKPLLLSNSRKKERAVWVRFGDVSDYFDFDSPFDAGKGVGMPLSEYPSKTPTYHYIDAGVEVEPYYTGKKYISLFWGDDNAQWIRNLSASDKKEFERGIRETLSFRMRESSVSDEQCLFCGSSSHRSDECDTVSPRDYHLLSWVGVPVPDYGFAVEPETKDRKIDEVLKRLKEGVDGIQQSDNFRRFLLTMSKFHDYSIGNLILIMMQRPNATRVAGFSTWKNLGRWVKKGERGIAILAPCFPPKEKRREAEEGEDRDEEEIVVSPAFFKVVHVFDLSQTEGKPLPEFEVPSLTGEANEELFTRIMELAATQRLEVGFESRPSQDPAIKGIYWGKSIWVRPEESRAQQLKTLIHEMAHYYSEDVFRIPRRDAETIAESVAFTVGAHFGFDSGVRSFSYVALWAEDKKVLETNLSAIRRISAKMMDSLESLKTGATGKT